MSALSDPRPHIVVLGAGFGGLTFCQAMDGAAVRITLIDRQNHHLFQPLLYQVATAGLAAPDIAQPVRSILSDQQNVTVLMRSVVGINLTARTVRLAPSEMLPGNQTAPTAPATEPLSYDYLILALGGRTSYFGHPEWEQHAPGLKSLEDALRIRRNLLAAFEAAESSADPAAWDRLLTMVVVGGGPTGVELAGAFAELARTVLHGDFRRIDPTRARVILIEASDRLLDAFPEPLAASARKQLAHLGVEVRTGARVASIQAGRVELSSGEAIEAANVVWAAGVAAAPLTKELGAPLDRAGRIQVEADCSIPAHPEAFAIGDIAHLVDKNGVPVPGVSPAAMQMARHVAGIIRDQIRGHASTSRPAFAYQNRGIMATIGRSSAVAQIGWLRLSGWPAWIAWLGIHLLFLIGFRNKLSVFLSWVWSYLTYKRGARVILTRG